MIHQDVIDRYLDMIPIGLFPNCEPDPGISYEHLLWMLIEMQDFQDEGKANRWLGFIQGILIERGLTTVQAERDFTRPYFSK